MSKIKLKKCPLCNEEFEVVGIGHYYAHKTNGCILQHMCFETDDEEAIKKWNTRKPMQEIVDDLYEAKSWYEQGTLDMTRIAKGIDIAIKTIEEVGEPND